MALDYRNYFTSSQKWLGIVKEIKQDTFMCELYDLIKPQSTIEIGELEIKSVPFEDRKMLSPGSVFYFSIGYENTVIIYEKRVELSTCA